METSVIDQTKLGGPPRPRRRRPVRRLRRGAGEPGRAGSASTGRWPAPARSARRSGARAGCAERYVREWLNAQAAGGYVDYHARAGPTSCRPSRRWCWPTRTARRTCPTPGRSRRRCGPARTRRRGLPHRQGRGLGGARRPPVPRRGRLLPQRLPRQPRDGVAAGARRRGGAAEAGTAVADVGCGHGHSALLLAEAFPRSRFPGFDAHAPSIEAARRQREPRRASPRGPRSTWPAPRLPRPGLRPDLLLRLPARPGRPGRRRAPRRRALAPDGTVMLVEPFANDRVGGQPHAGRRGSTTPPRP